MGERTEVEEEMASVEWCRGHTDRTPGQWVEKRCWRRWRKSESLESCNRPEVSPKMDELRRLSDASLVSFTFRLTFLGEVQFAREDGQSLISARTKKIFFVCEPLIALGRE